VAGRHRKVPSRHRHHGRHGKPPSASRAFIPAVTAVAVLAVGGTVIGQAQANGQSSHGAISGLAGIGVISSPLPSPSVLAVHQVRGALAGHHVAVQHHAQIRHHAPRHRVAPAALRITDTGSACYVQVTRKNGRLLVRRILHGHQHLTFRRHGLHVVLGNAGGVRIAVNGHHAHRAGRSGQVRRFHVG
jgi:Domain of unknown function (DUF4115)